MYDDDDEYDSFEESLDAMIKSNYESWANPVFEPKHKENAPKQPSATADPSETEQRTDAVHGAFQPPKPSTSRRQSEPKDGSSGSSQNALDPSPEQLMMVDQDSVIEEFSVPETDPSGAAKPRDMKNKPDKSRVKKAPPRSRRQETQVTSGKPKSKKSQPLGSVKPQIDNATSELEPPTKRPRVDSSRSVSPIEDFSRSLDVVPDASRIEDSSSLLTEKDLVSKTASHSTKTARSRTTKKSKLAETKQDKDSLIRLPPLKRKSNQNDDAPSSSPAEGSSSQPETKRQKTGPNASLRKSSSSNKPFATTKKGVPKLKPAEYAAYLVESGEIKPSKDRTFLEGKSIVYIGGEADMMTETTFKRMQKIIQWGGTLQSKYDANVTTHIIVDSGSSERIGRRELGVKSLREIPRTIPTLNWSWVQASMQDLFRGEAEEDFWDSYAVWGRVNVGKPNKAVEKVDNETKGWDKERIRKRSSYQEIPYFEDSEEEANFYRMPKSSVESLNSTNASSSSSREIEDPLAPFYARAMADIADQGGGDSKTDNLEGDVEMQSDMAFSAKTSNGKRKNWGWTVDQKPGEGSGSCPNQDVIDKLSELMKLHEAKPSKDDQWKTFAYRKAIRALRSHPTRIKSAAEARNLPGIAEKTANKIMEIIDTGALRRIDYETTPDVLVTKELQGIYGVGRTTAYQWYQNGIRSLDDVRNRKGGLVLSEAQNIGLRFYDDINDRMPREEAGEVYKLVKAVAKKIDPVVEATIMGSYRRGKKDCGDIDVMITRDPSDGRDHSGFLPRLLKDLHEANIITEDLALPDSSDSSHLEAIYRGLCWIPGKEGAKRRRIDFLCVPWESRGAALIYYTGDDIFNRAMRYKANRMGYSLNQRGLYHGVVRDPRNYGVKFNKGSILASNTEEEIFRILGVPWQEPHERVRNFG